MRRTPESLRESDLRILEAVLSSQGAEGAHGWLIADTVRARSGRLPGHGTLYARLARMVRLGLLERDAEDPLLAARSGRPPRRLYRVSSHGRERIAAGRTETHHPGVVAGALP